MAVPGSSALPGLELAASKSPSSLHLTIQELEKYGASHTNHMVSERKRGVSLNVKLLLHSPSKMQLSNKDAVEAVRRLEGAVDADMVKSIAQACCCPELATCTQAGPRTYVRISQPRNFTGA